MRFYTKSHTFYCGIDLHARWMYLCVLDQQGEVLLHRNLRACPEAFLMQRGRADACDKQVSGLKKARLCQVAPGRELRLVGGLGLQTLY